MTPRRSFQLVCLISSASAGLSRRLGSPSIRIYSSNIAVWN